VRSESHEQKTPFQAGRSQAYLDREGHSDCSEERMACEIIVRLSRRKEHLLSYGESPCSVSSTMSRD